ncbi:MAG: hypothetical protein KF708_17160 [Pirellulales bacterium]|nr:hypothetical protein [Pirellulales bacterium]
MPHDLHAGDRDKSPEDRWEETHDSDLELEAEDWDTLDPADDELASDRAFDVLFDEEDEPEDWRDEPSIEPDEWD